jgi:protein CMS1
MVHAHGDDLEDDYVPDSDWVIASAEEGRGGSDEEEEYYEEFQGIGDLELKSSDAQGDQSISKKRKRGEKEKEKKAKVRCHSIPQVALFPDCSSSYSEAKTCKRARRTTTLCCLSATY